MIGLLILIFFVVYLLVSVFVTKKTVSWAKANNRKPWLWGGLAAFMMYNLVFWDLIPTLAMHKYYCDTQAGFWVYKTPEQWKKENPELTNEDLKSLGEKMYLGSHAGKWIWNFPYLPFYNKPERHATMINKRIYLDGIHEKNISGVIPISKHVSFIADTKNDEKLAQQITFGSGYDNPMTTGGLLGFKEWLANDNCSGGNAGDEADKTGYSDFINQVVNLGK